MSQRRSKRHHYIAQSFQSRFCEQPDSIWYAERNQFGEFSLDQRSPFGCFWVKNLNTILVEDTPSDVLEKQFWGAVDQDLSHFLNRVDASFSSGNAPKIQGKALEDFKILFAVVARRSPDSSDLPEAVEVGCEYYEKLKTAFVETGHTMLAKHHDPIWHRQNGRAILAKAKASYPRLVVDALRDYSVRWAIPEGSSAFVLGSKFVYRAHGKGGSGHLEDPLTELYWPVSPKLALVLLRLPNKDFPMVTRLSQQRVRLWNEAICRDSIAVASHSKRLISSLFSERLKRRN